MMTTAKKWHGDRSPHANNPRPLFYACIQLAREQFPAAAGHNNESHATQNKKTDRRRLRHGRENKIIDPSARIRRGGKSKMKTTARKLGAVSKCRGVKQRPAIPDLNLRAAPPTPVNAEPVPARSLKMSEKLLLVMVPGE